MPVALIMRLNFDALALDFRAKDYKKVRPRYRQRSLTKRIVKKRRLLYMDNNLWRISESNR